MQGTLVQPLARELRSHTPQGNQACVPQLLSLCACSLCPQMRSPHPTIRDSSHTAMKIWHSQKNKLINNIKKKEAVSGGTKTWISGWFTWSKKGRFPLRGIGMLAKRDVFFNFSYDDPWDKPASFPLHGQRSRQSRNRDNGKMEKEKEYVCTWPLLWASGLCSRHSFLSVLGSTDILYPCTLPFY